MQALLAETESVAEVERVTRAIEDGLRRGRDVVLFTSRALVTGSDAQRALAIGQRVCCGPRRRRPRARHTATLSAGQRRNHLE